LKSFQNAKLTEFCASLSTEKCGSQKNLTRKNVRFLCFKLYLWTDCHVWN